MVGAIRKCSDALLTLKLKCHRPDQYRERVQVNTHITTRRVMTVPPSSMDEVAWAAWSTGPKEPSGT